MTETREAKVRERSLNNLRTEYRMAQKNLAERVAELFPLGMRCAIVRQRKGVEYEISGFVVGHPFLAQPTRLRIKTDSRGTIMRADYLAIRSLSSKKEGQNGH